MNKKITGWLKRISQIKHGYIALKYWLPYLLSGFSIRSKKIWLISSPYGFEGNSKYFYLFYSQILKEKYDIELYWLAQSSEQKNVIINHGVGKVIVKDSFSGYLLTFFAKVHISSHGTWCTNSHLSKKQLLVNLWHGIALKNMRFASSVELSRLPVNAKFSKFRFPDLYRKYDLFLSTSDVVTKHFSKCFDLPEINFFVSEYPRCKLLTMGRNDLYTHIKKNESKEIISYINDLEKFDTVFIYMPTWRDNNPKFLDSYEINWKEVNKSLSKKNFLLLVKLHPQSEVDFLMQFSHIKVIDPKMDIYPLLPFTDCLITDYSSIYFDYLLTDKDIALFTFDYDEYVTNCRDLAYNFDETMIGYRINRLCEFQIFFENYHLLNMRKFDEPRSKIKFKFWAKNTPHLNHFLDKILNLSGVIKGN